MKFVWPILLLTIFIPKSFGDVTLRDAKTAAWIMDNVSTSVNGPSVAESVLNSGRVLMQLPTRAGFFPQLQRSFTNLMAPLLYTSVMTKFMVVQVSRHTFTLVAIQNGKAAAVVGIKASGVLALGAVLGIGLANLDRLIFGGNVFQRAGYWLGDKAYDIFGKPPEWMEDWDRYIDDYLLYL